MNSLPLLRISLDAGRITLHSTLNLAMSSSKPIQLFLSRNNGIVNHNDCSRPFKYERHCTPWINKQQRKHRAENTSALYHLPAFSFYHQSLHQHQHYTPNPTTATMGAINFDASTSAPTSIPACPPFCSNANACHPILLALGFLYIFFFLLTLFSHTGQRTRSIAFRSKGADSIDQGKGPIEYSSKAADCNVWQPGNCLLCRMLESGQRGGNGVALSWILAWMKYKTSLFVHCHLHVSRS